MLVPYGTKLQILVTKCRQMVACMRHTPQNIENPKMTAQDRNQRVEGRTKPQRRTYQGARKPQGPSLAPAPSKAMCLGIDAYVLLFLKRVLKTMQASGATKHYPALRGPIVFAAI